MESNTSPRPSWAIAVAAVVVVALGLALGLLAGGENDADEATFEGGGFEFAYPDNWGPVEEVAFPVANAAGRPEDTAAVVGIDGSNWIVAYAFDRAGETPITAGNVMSFAPELERRYDGISRRLPDGAVEQAPFAIEVAGLPGLRLVSSYSSSGVENRLDTVQLLAADNRGYVIACNYTPTREAEVLRACEQALVTFLET